MANRGIRISELTTLASASMNTTIVGVASGITYKVELDTLATTIGSLLNTTDVNRLNNLESTSASVNTTNTAQNTRLTTIESVTGSYETKGRSIVSGSTQVTPLLPTGTVSGSSQILGGTQIISGAIYTHLVQYITIGGDLDFNI